MENKFLTNFKITKINFKSMLENSNFLLIIV